MAVTHTSDPTVSGPFEQFAETIAGTHHAAKPGIELINRLQQGIGIDVFNGVPAQLEAALSLALILGVR